MVTKPEQANAKAVVLPQAEKITLIIITPINNHYINKVILQERIPCTAIRCRN